MVKYMIDYKDGLPYVRGLDLKYYFKHETVQDLEVYESNANENDVVIGTELFDTPEDAVNNATEIVHRELNRLGDEYNNLEKLYEDLVDLSDAI